MDEQKLKGFISIGKGMGALFLLGIAYSNSWHLVVSHMYREFQEWGKFLGEASFINSAIPVILFSQLLISFLSYFSSGGQSSTHDRLYRGSNVLQDLLTLFGSFMLISQFLFPLLITLGMTGVSWVVLWKTRGQPWEKLMENDCSFWFLLSQVLKNMLISLVFLSSVLVFNSEVLAELTIFSLPNALVLACTILIIYQHFRWLGFQSVLYAKKPSMYHQSIADEKLGVQRIFSDKVEQNIHHLTQIYRWHARGLARGEPLEKIINQLKAFGLPPDLLDKARGYYQLNLDLTHENALNEWSKYWSEIFSPEIVNAAYFRAKQTPVQW